MRAHSSLGAPTPPCSPKVIAPRNSSDTRSPVRPRSRYRTQAPSGSSARHCRPRCRRPARGHGYVGPMTAIRLLLVDDDPLVRAGLSFMMGGAADIEIVGEAADGS